jgi:hypothetical protein
MADWASHIQNLLDPIEFDALHKEKFCILNTSRSDGMCQLQLHPPTLQKLMRDRHRKLYPDAELPPCLKEDGSNKNWSSCFPPTVYSSKDKSGGARARFDKKNQVPAIRLDIQKFNWNHSDGLPPGAKVKAWLLETIEVGGSAHR